MKQINTSRSHMKLGLAPQLIGLIVLVAIASGGLVGIELLNTSRNALRDEILRKNLSQADLAAQFTSNYISAVESSLRSFAAQPTMIQLVTADSRDEIDAKFLELLRTQPAMDNIGLYDPQGILRITGSTNKQTIGNSFADREWFQGALTTRKLPHFSLNRHKFLNNLAQEFFPTCLNPLPWHRRA